MYKEIKIKDQQHLNKIMWMYNAYSKERGLTLKTDFNKETRTLIVKIN